MSFDSKIACAAACVAAHVGLWLLFVFKISSGPEWVVGILSAGLATAAMIAVAHCAQIPFRPTPSMIAAGWRMPWYVLSGSWELLRSLANQLFTAKGADSYLAAVPYESCEDTHAAAARRALAVTYTTATPNFVVLGIVREQGILLFHQTLKGDVLQMTKNLGAHPPQPREV